MREEVSTVSGHAMFTRLSEFWKRASQLLEPGVYFVDLDVDKGTIGLACAAGDS